MNFDNFQWKSIKKLKYASIGVWGCLSCIDDQKDVKSYIYENNNKIRQNQEFSREVQEEKVEAIWNHKLFSEKFICYPLNVFFKSIGAVTFRIMWQDFKSN